MSNLASSLEYYIERKPTRQEILDAEEWQEDHPDLNICEYVEAMIQIGAL